MCMYDPQSGITHVSVDSHSIQFGCVSPLSVSEGKVREPVMHYSDIVMWNEYIFSESTCD